MLAHFDLLLFETINIKRILFISSEGTFSSIRQLLIIQIISGSKSKSNRSHPCFLILSSGVHYTFNVLHYIMLQKPFLVFEHNSTFSQQNLRLFSIIFLLRLQF